MFTVYTCVCVCVCVYLCIMSLKIGSISFKWLLSAVKKLSQCVYVCVYWCVCICVYLFAASPNIENICFNWFVVFLHTLLCVCVVLTCSGVVFAVFACLLCKWTFQTRSLGNAGELYVWRKPLKCGFLTYLVYHSTADPNLKHVTNC